MTVTRLIYVGSNTRADDTAVEDGARACTGGSATKSFRMLDSGADRAPVISSFPARNDLEGHTMLTSLQSSRGCLVNVSIASLTTHLHLKFIVSRPNTFPKPNQPRK